MSVSISAASEMSLFRVFFVAVSAASRLFCPSGMRNGCLQSSLLAISIIIIGRAKCIISYFSKGIFLKHKYKYRFRLIFNFDPLTYTRASQIDTRILHFLQRQFEQA